MKGFCLANAHCNQDLVFKVWKNHDANCQLLVYVRRWNKEMFYSEMRSKYYEVSKMPIFQSRLKYTEVADDDETEQILIHIEQRGCKC